MKAGDKAMILEERELRAKAARPRRKGWLAAIAAGVAMAGATAIGVAQNAGDGSLPRPPAINGPSGPGMDERGGERPPGRGERGPRGGRRDRQDDGMGGPPRGDDGLGFMPPPGGPGGFGGPGPGGPPGFGGPPGPPGRFPADDKDAAGAGLNRAYHAIGEFTWDRATTPDIVRQRVSSARTLYAEASTAYSAGQYAKTGALAEAAAHAMIAARELVVANGGTMVVSGLTPPPAPPADREKDRVAHDLNHAYNMVERAQRRGAIDKHASAWLQSADSLYREALTDYNAGRIDAASHLARAAVETGAMVGLYRRAQLEGGEPGAAGD